MPSATRTEVFDGKAMGSLVYKVTKTEIVITQGKNRVYIPLPTAKSMGATMLTDGACAEWPK